jgi:2-deoxy-D-gluconate 3-dehydrogenase
MADQLKELLEKLSDVYGNFFSLENRKAVVVGGNRGLGQAMALGLAGAGADVCIVARGPEGLEETANLVSQTGRKGYAIPCDVTVEENVSRMREEAEERLGGIDILINSQGRVELAPIADFDTEEWQKIIDVNLKSVYLCCKHIGRTMLQQKKGKIINISSVRGFQGRAEDPAYAPTKGAVNQLTKSLAIEWGVQGINVNGIAPVFTLTKMSASFLEDKEKREWVLSRIPMKRVGKLEDLVGPAIFLSSEASNFINGHTLIVDGGWLSA